MRLDKGWVGAVPEPLRPVIGSLVVLIGLLLSIPGLLWMLVPLRGARTPVVHFESTHIEIRGSLVPTTFVVDRDRVLEVHQWTFGDQFGRSFGIWPMVVVSLASQKERNAGIRSGSGSRLTRRD